MRVGVFYFPTDYGIDIAELARALEERGFEPKVRMELSTNEAIKQAIIAGLGVSIMSRQYAGVDLDANLTVLDVEGFPIKSHWYLVYPVGKQLSFIAQTFLDVLRKEAQRLDSVKT